MRKGWLGITMATGMLCASVGLAGAEDRKSLEELLVDKGVLTKDEAATVQSTKFSKWVDRVMFAGDLRLRHEGVYSDPAEDRHRQRFRIRLGPEIRIQDFTVGVRLASGTGDQVSTNQSFDNLSAKTPLQIDQAFLRWQGVSSRWVALTGGRMPNPFHRVYSSDVVWDDDFNPEGFAENFNVTFGSQWTAFLNLGQFVLDEDNGDKNDQWMYAQQLGLTMEPSKDTKATLAVAYYNSINVQDNNLGQNTVQPNNSRVPPPVTTPPTAPTNTLVNDYNVLDVTAFLGFKLWVPMAIMGDYVTNTADTVNAAGAETDDSGYQAGLIVGKASDPQTWEAAYFYKVLGADATLSDIADSDFGSGGTDRQGHIGWVAYNPIKPLQFKVKFLRTEVKDKTAAKDDIDRVQMDASIKF
jgi:hypothetical protein